MFTVQKCLYPQKDNSFKEGYIIMHPDYYPFYINKFLHVKNITSVSTCKQYAYRISKWLNYLEDKEIDYKDAKNEHYYKFLIYLSYDSQNNLINIAESKRSGFTIKSYSSPIKSLYRYLKEIGVSVNFEPGEISADAGKSFFFGQGMVSSNEREATIINNVFEHSKPVDYIKWYTDEQIEAIFSNSRTVRDKAIFSLSLDGMRIDEIITLRMSDYDDQNGIVKLYHSKGRTTGDTGRIVALSERSQQFLNDYIFNERMNVETDLLADNKILGETIFINLRKDKYYGQPIKYHSCLNVLKVTAKHAGLPPERIRTHSGRSTSAANMYQLQMTNPELNLTDEQIRLRHGWKRSESADPYKNMNDPVIALKTKEILENAKAKRNDFESDK
ncbi:MAG: tyrosine-type recombinase/integrase [Eubacterium sp.]|nr:tyrosine-type recombinase/integrase [Eubacterium sp.]